MDPSPYVPLDWALIAQAVNRLALSMGLALTVALTLTMTRSVLPSLLVTRPAVRHVLKGRWVLEPLAVAVGLVAFVNAWFALQIAYTVVWRVFPRIWI